MTAFIDLQTSILFALSICSKGLNARNYIKTSPKYVQPYCMYKANEQLWSQIFVYL